MCSWDILILVDDPSLSEIQIQLGVPCFIWQCQAGATTCIPHETLEILDNRVMIQAGGGAWISGG